MIGPPINERDPKRQLRAAGSKKEAAFLAAWAKTGMPAPEREYPFAKEFGRKWRFDFCWPSEKVAVEIEGGAWSGGRHTRGSGFKKDAEKYNAGVSLGYRILRYPEGNWDEVAEEVAKVLCGLPLVE